MNILGYEHNKDFYLGDWKLMDALNYTQASLMFKKINHNKKFSEYPYFYGLFYSYGMNIDFSSCSDEEFDIYLKDATKKSEERKKGKYKICLCKIVKNTIIIVEELLHSNSDIDYDYIKFCSHSQSHQITNFDMVEYVKNYNKNIGIGKLKITGDGATEKTLPYTESPYDVFGRLIVGEFACSKYIYDYSQHNSSFYLLCNMIQPIVEKVFGHKRKDIVAMGSDSNPNYCYPLQKDEWYIYKHYSNKGTILMNDIYSKAKIVEKDAIEYKEDENSWIINYMVSEDNLIFCGFNGYNEEIITSFENFKNMLNELKQ